MELAGIASVFIRTDFLFTAFVSINLLPLRYIRITVSSSAAFSIIISLLERSF
jgi:hypothetical protein